MPAPRKPRPRNGGATISDLAAYFRRRTTYVRRLAEIAGLSIRTVKPVRNGGRDTRPRQTQRRETEPLSEEQVRAVLCLHYYRQGLPLTGWVIPATELREGL
ncbi:MAG: hypothetical protein MJD61_07025 [Proteobacteria bacterium]|nr:hypothetical protein [Pseudomonadota bacterium]